MNLSTYLNEKQEDSAVIRRYTTKKLFDIQESVKQFQLTFKNQHTSFKDSPARKPLNSSNILSPANSFKQSPSVTSSKKDLE